MPSDIEKQKKSKDLSRALVRGRGTQAEPFNASVRHVVEYLIKKPRATVNKIKNDLKGKVQSISNLQAGEIDEGPLAEALRFRVDVSQKKYRDGAGTCFVSVKLKQNDDVHYDQFEDAVNSVDGVVEWDQISGADVDYLVRVVGRVASDRAKSTMIALGKLQCVERSYHNPFVTIWKSGIVDNFSPEDFLEFSDD